MIILYGLSFVSLLLGRSTASDAIPAKCKDIDHLDTETCAQPIEDVVAVNAGSFYTANVRCNDCPYYKWNGDAAHMESNILLGDYDLFFNVTLAHDRRTVLLNGKPFFPKISTLPRPPLVYTPQLLPDFTFQNLSSALACRQPACPGNTKFEDRCTEWCGELRLEETAIDYVYITKHTRYDAVADAQQWEFSVDAIGAFGGYLENPKWGFDNPSQKMLKVVVVGTEIKRKGPRPGQETPFSPLDDEKTLYEYSIVDVELVDRVFTFPPPRTLSFWERISKLFGNDISESEGRLVYMSRDWDTDGKIGTLPHKFNDFIHWHSWYLVGIIFGSVLAGLVVLYGLYRFYFWILQQRELMRWNGMEDVWDNLRREREEEENALLQGGYRDEPDEGGSSSQPRRYTDDLDTMKPLPTRPLPEKPLPDIPLIDA
ncbi:hypothetical protein IQ06DRAFT_351983 [Phaeosphaeriaceae sp. SRC1lsM3a]|nr:hypothetical protein IQ06DRAFT_351983 [Stagonospora sp. SRC1lsM3a]